MDPPTGPSGSIDSKSPQSDSTAASDFTPTPTIVLSSNETVAPESGGPGSGAVIGAAVGGGAGGLLIVFVIAFVCRGRRKRSRIGDESDANGVRSSGGGAIEMIPDNGDRTYTDGPLPLERQYSDPVDVRRPIGTTLYERPGNDDSSRPRF
jgi:hypothetical protein